MNEKRVIRRFASDLHIANTADLTAYGFRGKKDLLTQADAAGRSIAEFGFSISDL